MFHEESKRHFTQEHRKKNILIFVFKKRKKKSNRVFALYADSIPSSIYKFFRIISIFTNKPRICDNMII